MLNKTSLKNGIEALNNQLFADAATQTPAQASAAHAQGMADLIDAFVKSGDGFYVTGSLTAGSVVVTPTVTPPIIKIN